MDTVKEFEKKNMKSDVPAIKIGDHVKVAMKIVEGTRQRSQMFEGTVIAKHKGDSKESITVRKISYGVGVERIFPTHSPVVEKIEIVAHTKVRKAKLYYLREKKGKEARLKELR
jgi:large subunit ribosomal protein L19